MLLHRQLNVLFWLSTAKLIGAIERPLCDPLADSGAVHREWLIRVDSGLSVWPASASLEDRFWLRAVVPRGD